jgi:hypothetical protein
MRGKPSLRQASSPAFCVSASTSAFIFGGHFFDAARLDAAIFDEGFHRPARNLAADRIEAADGDHFGRIVDHEVDAQGLFEDSDVAAFAADDAALQFIGRKRNDGDGAFGRDFLSVLIASEESKSRALFSAVSRASSSAILDISGDLARHLVLDPGHDLVVGFLDDMPLTFSSSVNDAIDLGIEVLALLVAGGHLLAVSNIVLLIEGGFLLEQDVVAGVDRLLAQIEFVLIAWISCFICRISFWAFCLASKAACLASISAFFAMRSALISASRIICLACASALLPFKAGTA